MLPCDLMFKPLNFFFELFISKGHTFTNFLSKYLSNCLVKLYNYFVLCFNFLMYILPLPFVHFFFPLFLHYLWYSGIVIALLVIFE